MSSNSKIYDINKAIEDLRLGDPAAISPALLMPEQGGLNDYAQIAQQIAQQVGPLPELKELPTFEFDLKLGGPDEPATHFDIKAVRIKELLLDDYDEYSNIDEETAAQIQPLLDELAAVEAIETSAKVESVSKAKLGDKAAVQFYWKPEEARSKALEALDALKKGLTPEQKVNIKARLEQIRGAPHRVPTAAQKTAHSTAVTKLIASLSSIAAKTGKNLRCVVIPEESSGRLVIVSSNWGTREGLMQVNEVSEQDLETVEAAAKQTTYTSRPLYCVDVSATTTINTERGLSLSSNVEFIDRFPVYAPARTTGANPMACGPGWEDAYTAHAETQLELSLKTGACIDLHSSSDGFSFYARLADRKPKPDHKVYCKLITLAIPLLKPGKYKAPLTILIYTLPADAEKLAKCSFIVKDYAPIFHRYSCMKDEQRVQSALAVQFFRAFLPEGTFPIAYTETMARKSLDFEVWFPPASSADFLYELNRLGAVERQEKSDLSQSDELVKRAIAVMPVAHDPTVVLEHDTPLQRLLSSWVKKRKRTLGERKAVEQEEDAIAAAIKQLIETEKERTVKALREINPDLADTLQPYLSSRAFTTLQRLDTSVSELDCLLELAQRADHAKGIVQDEADHGALWAKSGDKQTPESVAAATRVIRFFARDGTNLPKKPSLIAKEALRLLGRSKTAKAKQQKYNQMNSQKPQHKAARKAYEALPSSKEKRKKRDQSDAGKKQRAQRMVCMNCLEVMSRNAYTRHYLHRCSEKELCRGQWYVGDDFEKKQEKVQRYVNASNELDDHVALAQLEAFFKGQGKDRRVEQKGHELKLEMGSMKRPLDRAYVNVPVFTADQPLVVSDADVQRRWASIVLKMQHLFGEEE